MPILTDSEFTALSRAEQWETDPGLAEACADARQKA
jgi:hypothetical protein